MSAFPLFVFIDFIKELMALGVQLYLGILYSSPLVFVSVFVPLPYSFGHCSLMLLFEVG